LTALSQKLNIDPHYLAIIWVCEQKEIDGIILGPSNQKQLKDLLKVISYEVSKEILNELNDN
jgi:aryl-alcohol dehydrogenase-like predicted oxidoreductase